MSMFDEDIKKQLREMLQNVQNKVNILYFTQQFECGKCKETGEFIREFSDLSDKLQLTEFEFQKDKEKAEYQKIDKVPAILLLDTEDNDTGIRFYGIPGGYEINSFMHALFEVSGKQEALPEKIKTRINTITKDIHIQVFISLSCPYCPQAVSAAHKLALENSHIRGDMVETSAFPELAVRYNVSSVPKIVINESHELLGAQPLEAFLDIIEKI